MEPIAVPSDSLEPDAGAQGDHGAADLGDHGGDPVAQHVDPLGLHGVVGRPSAARRRGSRARRCPGRRRRGSRGPGGGAPRRWRRRGRPRTAGRCRGARRWCRGCASGRGSAPARPAGRGRPGRRGCPRRSRWCRRWWPAGRRRRRSSTTGAPTAHASTARSSAGLMSSPGMQGLGDQRRQGVAARHVHGEITEVGSSSRTLAEDGAAQGDGVEAGVEAAGEVDELADEVLGVVVGRERVGGVAQRGAQEGPDQAQAQSGDPPAEDAEAVVAVERSAPTQRDGDDQRGDLAGSDDQQPAHAAVQARRRTARRPARPSTASESVDRPKPATTPTPTAASATDQRRSSRGRAGARRR